MANHVRRRIREAIASAVTGLASTGARVFQSRVYALQATDLPALKIETQSESITAITFGFPRLYERRLRVRVYGLARATADLDDIIDQICQEVETALAMPVAALVNLAETITFVGTEIDMTGEGEQPHGRATMTFEVLYITEEDAPDVSL